MASLRLSKAAKRDLIEIARYTLEHWGDEQRKRYLGQLDARFRWIARNPEMGLASDHIKPGYRRCAEGRHVIFYRLSATCVEIIRILHVRMMPRHHL